MLTPSRSRSRGFTLIELLVVIAIIAVLIALLLPAVQSAREAARRSQCVNNLKQLALASMSYESSNGVLPPGSFWAPWDATGRANDGFSCFVTMLPFLEQRPVYDTVNFSFTYKHAANVTVAGTVISTLLCPSDYAAAKTDPLSRFYPYAPAGMAQAHTSYAGSTGAWNVKVRVADANFAQQVSNPNGLVFMYSAIRVAQITDGLSNTMVFGEWAHSLLSAADQPLNHLWNSGYWYDTLFETYYPINAHKKPVGVLGARYTANASSLHPGGANFAFADGSVRFLKDSIDSWPIDAATITALGVAYDASSNLYSFKPGARVGVYQALSTRSGGEVVGSDAY